WDFDTDRLLREPSLAALVGLPPGEALEISGAEFFAEVHPDDRATVEDTLSKLLSASETRLFAQYRWRRGDGSYATVRDSGVIVRDARGEAMRVVGTLVDISERVQLEARVALSDRMASIGTLAAGVAHEINNPLTYVMANVDLAIDALHAGVPTHDLLEMLREAREGCTRVSRVVHDLGVFSRPREDEETLEITQVIDSAIKMSWNHIRHRAQLVRDHGPTPRVQMNRSRLGQVILNLLVNAAQAIVDGNATQNQIRIRTATELDGRALIEITDTGPGIPPHVLGHIFEPFFTTKPVGAGTGLGLSICHTIITAAGGHIDIASGASGGCTVRVTLPAARTVDKPVAALPLAAGRKRILLVDDEPSIRRALRRMLEHTNDVEVAESGEQALEKLLANDRFDIIFCDLMMPTMSGIDLYERLLADCAPLAERMVFMTGGAFSERSREFLADCGRPIVEKPFDRQTIDRVISAVAQ
ncbi:MAG TPA: ATP-binding protein, partial [Kofleriaceae bacterium]|nr:ATP-binding protein [Kofleriaceae bacterium]